MGSLTFRMWCSCVGLGLGLGLGVEGIHAWRHTGISCQMREAVPGRPVVTAT